MRLGWVGEKLDNVQASGKKQIEILKKLRKRDATIRDLSKDFAHSTVYDSLSRLIKKGLVTKRGEGKNAIYSSVDREGIADAGTLNLLVENLGSSDAETRQRVIQDLTELSKRKRIVGKEVIRNILNAATKELDKKVKGDLIRLIVRILQVAQGRDDRETVGEVKTFAIEALQLADPNGQNQDVKCANIVAQSLEFLHLLGDEQGANLAFKWLEQTDKPLYKSISISIESIIKGYASIKPLEARKRLYGLLEKYEQGPIRSKTLELLDATSGSLR
jgi:DNA-binding transcriptional ArsR family regulator